MSLNEWTELKLSKKGKTWVYHKMGQTKMQSASGVEFIRSDTSWGCFQRIFLLLDKILILTVLSANWQLNGWSLNFSRLASIDVLPNWEILTALTKVQSSKVRDHGLQASNEYVFSLKKLHTNKNTIINFVYCEQTFQTM